MVLAFDRPGLPLAKPQQLAAVIMHPSQLSISDFHYELPQGSIANVPSSERDLSRLLIWDEGRMTEDIYRNIADHLPGGSMIVLNRTRVVEARLIFEKPSGGKIELFALEPSDEYPDITTAMRQKATVRWKCLVGGASKWKKGWIPEKEFHTADGPGRLRASLRERINDSFLVELDWTPEGLNFGEILQAAGQVPLPPYIKRPPNSLDHERYQTIYAEGAGSVAAPTAGLHFTEKVFNSLMEKEIQPSFVTLHVGAGTFKPVKSDIMNGHTMHAERIEVQKSFIQKMRDHKKGIYLVGTTSLRTIESLYWLGCKIMKDPLIPASALSLEQWDPYDVKVNTPPANEVLHAVVDWMDRNGSEVLHARTSLIVAPGYSPRFTDGLITNFHQPQSTLLLLVAALMGDEWKRMYAEAITKGFRMLSYGDGCLIHYRSRIPR